MSTAKLGLNLNPSPDQKVSVLMIRELSVADTDEVSGGGGPNVSGPQDIEGP
ncbi:MAG: hypothetical protein JNM52_09095 [Betaproteobacteria bacterium]|nr:hypothetical protein [Betaproteobacteria bacterium]